jgi:hypothetical protein
MSKVKGIEVKTSKGYGKQKIKSQMKNSLEDRVRIIIEGVWASHFQSLSLPLMTVLWCCWMRRSKQEK